MQPDQSVNLIDSEEHLDDVLSTPTPALCDAMARLDGDILILGVGGKMGPTLARLARRAADVAGPRRHVIGVSRFETGDVSLGLQQAGIRTIQCDLMDESAIAGLPTSPNVIYLAGRKFGTDENPALTWVMNAYVPALVARHFRNARIVALSSGNVYPLSPVTSPGPAETDPVGPVGEYAQSCLARERIFDYFSARYGTRVTLVRLNYAVELRYGVLLDIARKVHAREAIDLTMGYVNLIWQRDANEVVIRCLELCASPPEIVNLAGPMVPVRQLAERFATFFGIDPVFTGQQSDSALLSDGRKAARLFGPQTVSLDRMIELVAHWVSARGKVHGLPTHFEQRQGHY